MSRQENMVCSNCGMELERGERHCPRCGARSSLLLHVMPSVALKIAICIAAFSEVLATILSIDAWLEIYDFIDLFIIIPIALFVSFIKWGMAWYLMLYRLPQDREVWMRWVSVVWLIAVGAVELLNGAVMLLLFAEEGFVLELGLCDYVHFGALIVAILILVCAMGVRTKLRPTIKRSGKQWFTIYGDIVGWLIVIVCLPSSAGWIAEKIHSHSNIGWMCIWGIMFPWGLWKGFKDFDKAYHVIEPNKISNSEDLEDLFVRGFCHENGVSVAKDYIEAIKWYRKAAEMGHADAQNNLGLMYAYGKGADKDEAEAARLFQQAAEQGHVTAQFNLGVSYHYGWGVAKDESEAMKWCRKAAGQGDYAAQLYIKAMEQGWTDAQHVQGETHVDGESIEKYDAEAVRWYRKAAENGDAEAQWHLGTCYQWGNGVAQDEAEAAKWYRKAAEQGHRNAIEVLEELKENGLQGDTSQYN